MFMLSLMQPSGLYELEKDSLDAISAQLLQMIQVKVNICISILYKFLIMQSALLLKWVYLTMK